MTKNLKQFLKPDWRKIVIFIIITIVLLATILLFIYGSSANLGRPIGDFCCSEVIAWNENCPFSEEECENMRQGCEFQNYTLENCERMKIEKDNQIIIFFLSVIIFSYLLSCLIVWIYDKFRGRKK